nr:serine hydrolase [Ancylobacter mangrovi]
MLGGALERASGERLEDFPRQALFEPLGIDTFEWVAMSNGEAAAASGLRLSARDMAKIGQLVLDGGVWKGRRVVSEDWITESTAPRFEGWRPMRYGYQWWVGASPHAGGEVSWIAAIGLGGQRIFIVPALDLVVVSTAGLYRDPDQGAFSRAVLEKVVLPAVREGGERPSAPR